MSLAKYLTLIALCLSDGGIGLSSDTVYIHFTNKSKILLDLFKEEIRRFSNNKIHQQNKPRGITLRVFDKSLALELFKISPSYRTRPCNHFPICPFLKGKNNYKTGKHNHIQFKDLVYTEIKIPEALFQNIEEKAFFMRIYASCDGYPSLFPRKNSWSAVERIVGIVCHHPFLKQRLHEILLDLGISHNIKPNSLEMRSKTSISQFQQKIGFIKGVNMTGNSKYWEGQSKNEVLRKIIRSYSIKFTSRDPAQVISCLKNI